jgi:hypothetical protein
VSKLPSPARTSARFRSSGFFFFACVYLSFHLQQEPAQDSVPPASSSSPVSKLPYPARTSERFRSSGCCFFFACL